MSTGWAYPLKLQPALHRRVWGGDRLEQLFTAEAPRLGPEGEPVGESWLAGDDSAVLNGPLAGRRLGGLAAEFGAGLVGSVPFARYGGRVPLLAKLLDAAQPLSVQVHPNDDYALLKEAHTGHLGKSEAWLVLQAEPGASVLWGLKPGTTPPALRQAATEGTLPDHMFAVPVQPGSVVVNPAGTVHAVGAGILLYEIQQASDLTYRLYDFGRLDAKGLPRQLHLDQAVAVADFSGTPFTEPAPRPLGGAWRRLVALPEFVLDRAEVSAGRPVTGRVDSASMQILTVVEGDMTLAAPAAGRQPQALGMADTVVLPAALAGNYELTGSGVVVRSAVPSGAAP